jgi:hypothetical protein
LIALAQSLCPCGKNRTQHAEMTIMPGESLLTSFTVTNSSPEPLHLPRRTGRNLPPGRHRSPHRLTLPPDAPALVLAVPGVASARNVAIATEIGEAASQSCPGAEVRVGFLEGTVQRLTDAMIFDHAPSTATALQGVVVPLLAGPNPGVDQTIEELTSQAAAPLLLASHLGPHPLVAEGLHARLAEAGLAREGRARGLSIVPAANGVLVLANGGDEAVQAAGVAAVLLAARLAAPATNGSFGDLAAVKASLSRLRAAGVSQPALAPCVIGPETDLAELTALSEATGAPHSQPLGAHPAVAQLVAIRYGAALAGLRMAGSAG